VPWNESFAVCVQIVPFTCCVYNEQIVSEGSALN